MLRALIVTAIPVERQAVCAHLDNLREEEHPQGTLYDRGEFASGGQTWDVLIALTQAGNERAGIETERALQHFQPQVAIFVGIAGGLKDVQLGDVVVASSVYAYEYGKQEENGFKTRPDSKRPTYRIYQRAVREAINKTWLDRIVRKTQGPLPTVYVKPIAAGNKVLASVRAALYEFLRAAYNDACAVDMEDSGFLEAGYANPKVETLVVRGISDLLNDKAVVDRAGYQEVAAEYASAFAFEVLANWAEGAPEPVLSETHNAPGGSGDDSVKSRTPVSESDGWLDLLAGKEQATERMGECLVSMVNAINSLSSQAARRNEEWNPDLGDWSAKLAAVNAFTRDLTVFEAEVYRIYLAYQEATRLFEARMASILTIVRPNQLLLRREWFGCVMLLRSQENYLQKISDRQRKDFQYSLVAGGNLASISRTFATAIQRADAAMSRFCAAMSSNLAMLQRVADQISERIDPSPPQVNLARLK